MVLEKSDENFCSVADDKLALESYLTLQQLTHNNSFSYQIDTKDDVDEDFDLLPSLVTQPFVENAVLHGLKNTEEGVITITYFKKDNSLYVSIKDNGKGFETQKEDSKRFHKSMSMNIIKEQLKNLSKTFKGFTGDITINSSNKGTEILLHFTS